MPKLHIDLTKHTQPVQKAAHAIGLNNKRPYKRQGNFYYRPYRNYFVTHIKSSDHSVWMGMYNNGYAGYRHVAGSDSITFYLTRAGLDWLGETLGITIHDEEE